MKKFFISMMIAMATISGYAQKNLEPEYIGQVVVVNADSTTTLLQKETTEMKTKSSKFGMIPVVGSGLLDKTKSNLVVKGAASKTMLEKGTLTFIIRADNNNYDPKDVFGILQFEVKKKQRLYTMAEGSILGGIKATTTFNTVPYKVEKYGSSSYVIVIQDAKPGQYGITTGDFSQIITFGVK